MRVAAFVLSAFVVCSCSSSYRSMSVEEKRSYLADLEVRTLAELVEEHPDAQADLDRAVGYAVFSNRATKIPIVGAGEGIGVVVNTTTGKRSYLRVSRLDVGGGLGIQTYLVVIVFFEEQPLQKLAQGTLEFAAGFEASAGSHEAGIDTRTIADSRKEDRVVYQLSEAGVSATWTVRAIRYSVLDLGE